MATTAPTQQPLARSVPKPGFMNTLASEWTKLRTVRSTWYIVALAIGLSIGLSALIGWATAWSFSEWTAEDAAMFDPTVNALAGSMFGIILFAVLGVTAVATEYSSGMIRQTFSATPRRGRVFIAKIVILALISLLVGIIAMFGMFLITQPIFGAYDVPTASLGDDGVLRLLTLASITSPVVTIVGAALAVFLRSGAGAITASLALLFLPSMFGGFLPTWWQENVLAYLIWPAADSIIYGNHELFDQAMYLSPGAGTVVTIAWLVLFIGGAIFALNRRDA